MATGIPVGEQIQRAASPHDASSDEGLEARSFIDTPDGLLELVACCHGDRWEVRASCAGREGHGLGPNLGIALLAALQLCDAQGEELF